MRLNKLLGKPQLTRTVKLLCTVLFLSLLQNLPILTTSHPAFAQPASYYFPETGHTVAGRFLEYWNGRGGLMQQGYPLSEEMQEASDIDGKTYTVQYFERALFERHPENQPPYDVLLSLLGSTSYAGKYPNGAPDQKPNESQGSISFPETGKRLGGSFLAYWQQFGGLQQQGYPISDEIQEQSELDGKTYTVQYFERSVMEWHPGNPPPYDVLLSQLGKFRYEAYYGANTQPAGEPKLIARSIQSNIASSGNILAYERDISPNHDPYNRHNVLFGFDILKSSEFLISDAPAEKYSIAMSGKTVVWNESADQTAPQSSEQPMRLFSYDIQTMATSEVFTTTITSRTTSGIALDDSTLFYNDLSPVHKGLYAYNLITHEERLISETGYNPVSKNGQLLWTETKPDDRYGFQSFLHYSANSSGSTQQIIVSTYSPLGFSGYDMSATVIVWGIDDESRGVNVYWRELGSDQFNLLGKSGVSPHILGQRIVWTAGNVQVVRPRGISTSIQMFNFVTMATTKIIDTTDLRPFAADLIGPNTLLFTRISDVGFDSDLYLTKLGCLC